MNEITPKLRGARSRLYRRKQASKQVRSVSPRKEKRPRNPRATKYDFCNKTFVGNGHLLESYRCDLHHVLRSTA